MKQMGQVTKAATAIAAGKADGARLARPSRRGCSRFVTLRTGTLWP